MKKALYLLLTIALLWPANANAEKKKTFIVGFYNLENLFDIYDDPVKRDDDFTPNGSYKWTEEKYNKKLHNMASVIEAMAKTNGRWHTLLGVCEVENRLVLEDLVSQKEIVEANYQIVHYESPDKRGIDCALLYNPSNFKYLDSEAIPFDFNSDIEFTLTPEDMAQFKTRDILMTHGLLDGEDFAIYVAHLPSRIGGKGQDLRARGAEIIYNHAMQMMEKYPGIKIAVMGDMNDNSYDESMTVWLHGRETIDEVGEGDFFLPFIEMMKAGFGTLAYQGVWNLFDNILVNYNLCNADKGSLKIRTTGKKGYYGVVFKEDWMLNQSGNYKGQPFRTNSGGSFINGYSAHLPTYIVLEK